MGRISAKGRSEPFRHSKESVANSNVPNLGKELFRWPISRHRTSFCRTFLTYVVTIAVRTIVPDYAVPYQFVPNEGVNRSCCGSKTLLL
jgi:hypothetical protein